MKRTISGAVIAILGLGCGDDFRVMNDGGTPEAGEDVVAPPVEGGTRADASDASPDGSMPSPKPRLFATLQHPMSSAVAAWIDPDKIMAPRPADVVIMLADATDLAIAKSKRLFVAGGSNVYVFDDPLSLTSQSTPKTLTKSNFIGLQPNDIITVTTLAYNGSLDALVTGDQGASGLQIFKAASTMPLSSSASAKFGGDSDRLIYPVIASNGTLYGPSSNSRTYFWDAATLASGSNPAASSVVGWGKNAIDSTRMYVPTSDFGQGGAAVYVYALPLTNNAQPAFELKFGGPQTTFMADSVVVTPNMLAVGIIKANAKGAFICVYDNVAQLSGASTCKNTIDIDTNNLSGMVLRLAERKGSLYASVVGEFGARIEIYRSPLTDKSPTVSLDLGMRFASSLGFAE